jgi:glutamate-1-semialdehyde aminotransferase/spore coat polysaccharide biosynthesis protein SpsF (cytidylyltransferase family)
MKTIAIIQARMDSSRFPGKVLKKLLDRPILEWVVNAATKISLVDEIIVATSIEDIDLPIVEWCQKSNVTLFRGSEVDVLDRFYKTAKHSNADYIIRLTADCPLLNPEVCSQILYLVTSKSADYASNIMPATWPDGLDCEAFTFSALEFSYLNAKRPSEREHVTSFIRNNQHLFNTANVPCPIPALEKHRWTIDTLEDLNYLEALLEKCDTDYTLYNILKTIKSMGVISQPTYKRNEGFDLSLQNEHTTCLKFDESQKFLKRALKAIPLGSQTFSKSYIQFPEKSAPFFASHGLGGHIWDIDGNEYIDLVSALLPNVLGYADPEINFAIHSQLQKGITFSLATTLEVELADKLCSIIPSAEKVRFAKNGTDVTSAAVRLARAYTRRDKMIVCGYHGWQDWYIGTTSRNKGIPKAVSDLSVSVPYNDLEIIESLIKTEEYAGIIMEPCNTQPPSPGYLQGIKDCCERYGTVFIFDEIITGFRFALGGAQEYFDVTPHLSCFGKAMANGMPISAIVGRSDIMAEMNEVFFSGTFGGETLSLAAALATINKLQREKVIDYLWGYGQDLGQDVKKLALNYKLENVIQLSGYAPWKILQFHDRENFNSFEIKTFFIQEMIKRGILLTGSHNICYQHNDLDKQKIIYAYEATFEQLASHLSTGNLRNYLESPAIRPLFSIR